MADPTFLPRSAWNAAPAHSSTPRAAAQITTVHLHYGDMAAPNPDPSDVAKATRGVQMFHMAAPPKGRGWWDIGYHFTVGGLVVCEGRPVLCVGAETEGHNTPSVGVCVLIGPGDELTDDDKRSVLFVLNRLDNLLGRRLDVRPHSADVATSCPGDAIRAWIAAGLPSPDRAPTVDPAPAPAPAPAPEPTPAPVTPPNPAPAPTPAPDPVTEAISMLPTITKGANGQAVRNAQALMLAHGQTVTVDGDFGPRTDRSVRAFQANRQLSVDGVVGPVTWAALVAAG